MSMFDNYPQSSTYVPNNQPTSIEEPTYEISIGGTATHTFILDFSYAEKCSKFEVIYNQYLDTVLTIEEGTVTENSDGTSTIVVTVDASDTKKFNYFQTAYLQLKLTMKDGTVMYGDAKSISIMDTLDKGGSSSSDSGGSESEEEVSAEDVTFNTGTVTWSELKSVIQIVLNRESLSWNDVKSVAEEALDDGDTEEF